MKVRKHLSVFTVVALVMLFAGFSMAQKEEAPVKPKKPVLQFVGDNEFAPYSFYPDGSPAGYSVDLTKILSATIDRDINIRLMSWEKCLSELRTGQADGIIGAPVYKQREDFINYSEPVGEIEYAIFVQMTNSYVNSIKSLQGTVVGVYKESLIINELQKYDRITLLETDSVLEALNKLKNREVTAVIAEKNVSLYYIQKNNIRALKIVGPPLEPVYPYAMAIAKDDTELLELVNWGIAVLKENNTLRKLRRKWFGLQLVERFPWRMVIFTTSGITLIMLGLAGVLWVVSLNATVKSKTEQIKIMSRKMVEKDKLAVLGKLAGQIAHELRTPLSIINNSVFLLRKEGSDNRDLFEKRLRILEEKIKLSSNILESILSYSRVKAEVAMNVSVKECLDEVLKDLQAPEEIEKKVTLKNESSLFVFMDFHQLYSVIRNIALNSLQAMVDKGTLTIEAFPSDDSTTITITICDTGPGILASAQNRIFNLFYSTKITGTGLGLPISKSIIEANDGELFLEETTEKGTCFTIKLPSAKKAKK